MWNHPFVRGFPLFALATSKEAWVNEVWTAAGERGGSWSPCFNRPFNDWELEEVERLFCCLDEKKVSIDLSMIGSWKKWKGCFVAWVGRRLVWMRRIR